jgi:16S rRNA (cytosine967-C5)-methyltransferase
VAAERVTPSRVAALEALRAVRAGDLADRALDRSARALDPRDRAWTQELVFGTFRTRGRIDYLLDRLVKGGTAALEPDVLDVLRLGAYQLLEMGSVPRYAAVSQSVELAREAGVARAAGLVNGVLQSLLRRGEEIAFPDQATDPVGDLVTRGSHPAWLVERWVERFGLDDARALVDANNRRPELYLTVLDEPVEVAVERLREAGIEAEPVAFAPDSVKLPPGASPREAMGLVRSVVQDPAASLVVRYASPEPGARVLDLCAAPGGKAIGLARSARSVVAVDLSARRLSLLRDSVERLSLDDRVELIAADAREANFEPAELVLLDVPCTGTGTLRRHPDGRWRIGPGDLADLRVLQAELLEAAARFVESGGLLVYSTCSLEPEENAGRAAEFLRTQPEYRLEPPAGAVDPALLTPEGFLHVLPQRQGVDGSFAARFRRSA